MKKVPRKKFRKFSKNWVRICKQRWRGRWTEDGTCLWTTFQTSSQHLPLLPGPFREPSRPETLRGSRDAKNPTFKPGRTISSKNNHGGFPSLWHFWHMWAACIVELTWVVGGKESGVMWPRKHSKWVLWQPKLYACLGDSAWGNDVGPRHFLGYLMVMQRELPGWAWNLWLLMNCLLTAG